MIITTSAIASISSNCIGNRRANVGGTVGKHLHRDRFWQAFDKLREHGANAVGGFSMMLAPGWRCTFITIACCLLAHAPSQPFFRALFNGGDVTQTYRRTVLVGNNQLTVLIGRLHLIVGRERHGAGGAVQRAFRRVDVGVADGGGADGFAGQPQRSDGLRIKLTRTAGRWVRPPALPARRRRPGKFSAPRGFRPCLPPGRGMAEEVTARVMIGGSAGFTFAVDRRG